MDSVASGILRAQGQPTDLQRNRVRAINDAIQMRSGGGGGASPSSPSAAAAGAVPLAGMGSGSTLQLSPQQIRQRRKVLDKHRPRREQLSQAELRSMGPVKMLPLHHNNSNTTHDHQGFGDANQPLSYAAGGDQQMTVQQQIHLLQQQQQQQKGSGSGALSSVLATIPQPTEEDDALADSAEQEELLRLLEEEKRRQEALAAEQRAADIERQLYFGPADGEEPRPFPELSSSTAVGYYSHLERRARQLNTLQQSRVQQNQILSQSIMNTMVGAHNNNSNSNSNNNAINRGASYNEMYKERQQQQLEGMGVGLGGGGGALGVPLNPTLVLDRCQAALDKSAPLVTVGPPIRHAGTGAVLGRAGQNYATRELQKEAEAAVIRKVEGLVGDTVGINIVIGSSVLKHLVSVEEKAAASTRTRGVQGSSSGGQSYGAASTSGSVLTTLKSNPTSLMGRGGGGGGMAARPSAQGGSIGSHQQYRHRSISPPSPNNGQNNTAAPHHGSPASAYGGMHNGSPASLRKASLTSLASSSSPRSAAGTNATTSNGTNLTGAGGGGGGGGGTLPTVRNSVLNLVRQSMGYEELLAFNDLQSVPGTIHNNSEHRRLQGYDPMVTEMARRAARALPEGYVVRLFTPDLDDFSCGTGEGSDGVGTVLSSTSSPVRGVGGGNGSPYRRAQQQQQQQQQVAAPAPPPLSLGTVLFPANATVHQAVAIILLKLLMMRSALGLYREGTAADGEGTRPATAYTNANGGQGEDDGYASIPSALRRALAVNMNGGAYDDDGDEGLLSAGGSGDGPFLSFLSSKSPFAVAADHPLCSLFAALKLIIGPLGLAVESTPMNTVTGADVPSIAASGGAFAAAGVAQSAPPPRNSGGGPPPITLLTTQSVTKFGLARVVPEAINGGGNAGATMTSTNGRVVGGPLFGSSANSQQQQMMMTTGNTSNGANNSTSTFAAQQADGDLAVVIAAVTATIDSAKTRKQRQLALQYQSIGGSRGGSGGARRSGSSGIGTGGGRSGPTPSAALATQMAASAAAKASQQAQLQAVQHIAAHDPLSLAAIEHLLFCGASMLLSTGFYCTIPSAWRPVVPMFNNSSSSHHHSNRNGGRLNVTRRRGGGGNATRGADHFANYQQQQQLIGIHQQRNAQRYHVTPYPQQQQQQKEVDGGAEGEDDEDGGDANSGGAAPASTLGGLVDPYHNPITVPMPVAIASRPLLRTMLKKLVSTVNRAEHDRVMSNITAASKHLAADAALSKSIASGGGGSGGTATALGPLNKYPVTVATAQQLQQKQQQLMRSVGVAGGASSGGGDYPSPTMSTGDGSPSYNNYSPTRGGDGLANAPSTATGGGKILPEATMMAALSPPYVLTVEIPPLWEALISTQAAEVRHRRLLEDRYATVALPFYTAYHHHCVLREGLMRQTLEGMEGRAFEALLYAAHLGRHAAERATVERVEEAIREEQFLEPYDRVSRHLWPMLMERLAYGNVVFADLRRDVADREQGAFRAAFGTDSAPYSAYQLRCLRAIGAQRHAYLASYEAFAVALERESVEARRRVLSEFTTRVVKGRREANGDDRAAASLL